MYKKKCDPSSLVVVFVNAKNSIFFVERPMSVKNAQMVQMADPIKKANGSNANEPVLYRSRCT